MTQDRHKQMKEKSANQMWGGRFAAGPSAIMEKINVSIDFDQRLFEQDIEGSLAHCKMLVAQQIITEQDGAEIEKGLAEIRQELREGRFTFNRQLEDIHMNIEARLRELIGPAAGRLHTGRSRNDQVATDFRLWVCQQMRDIDDGLAALQTALINQAEKSSDMVMPGYTHLQPAQPVTFGHHMMAYVEMIGRDRGRFQDALARANESPLGAAALAGTSFPIDRHMTASALGFDRPMANSLDAVSDRDYALEFLSAASICAVHLSRLAEEIVMWTSTAFRFISLSDAFTTGSSIMPQKKNPDAAELVRGKSGRVIGALNSLLIMLKGLPLTYGKDMQDDKEPTFEAADTISLCIAVMTGMIDDLEPQADQLKQATAGGFITATDLADWLVRVLNMPFRDAHHVTGSLVALAEKKSCDIADLSLSEMQSVHAEISEDIFSVLTVEASVASRTSFGGTAPENVKQAAQAAKQRFNLG